jgi:hypothetical protein
MISWQDLGAIGDFVGGVAVVVSLIYVGFQIRQNSRHIEQNSRQIQASSYHATNDAFYRWFSVLAEDAELAALWRRALAGEPLKDDEITRVHSLLAMIFLAFENFFEQYRLGAVTRKTLEVSRPDLLDLLSRPVAQAWWQRYAPRILTPEFRATVDALMARGGTLASTATATAFDGAIPPA